MTTLTLDTIAHLGVLEDLTRKPRELDEIPELLEPNRKAMAAIPTPKSPDDRL